MTFDDKLRLYQQLVQTNRTLAKSLSEARFAASQHDHHLVQHDSAPAFDRLQFLLAQAIALLQQKQLSHSERQQLLGQLDQLSALCQPQPEPASHSALLRKVYE